MRHVYVLCFLVPFVGTVLAGQACSSSQADRAALVRDGIKTASDLCTAYERGPKRDARTDSLCLALELAQRVAEAPSIEAAAGGKP